MAERQHDGLLLWPPLSHGEICDLLAEFDSPAPALPVICFATQTAADGLRSGCGVPACRSGPSQQRTKTVVVCAVKTWLWEKRREGQNPTKCRPDTHLHTFFQQYQLSSTMLDSESVQEIFVKLKLPKGNRESIWVWMVAALPICNTEMPSTQISI